MEKVDALVFSRIDYCHPDSRKNKRDHKRLCCQTDLEVSPSVGGGRCEALVRATGPGLEGEARRGRPSNGSESGGAAPGFLTQLPPQTGRETTCGPEPERALKEPAAGTAPPYWG